MPISNVSPFFDTIAALLLLTCFVKILTTLNLLRFGLGLQGGSFGLVMVAASLGLSLLVMSPQIERAGGVEKVLQSSNQAEHATHLEANFRPFVEKHTNAEVLARFGTLEKKLSGSEVKNETKAPSSDAKLASTAPFPVLIASFIISELKEAFQLGLMLLIPFLIIDLLVVNVLMAVGVTQMPSAVLALPCKLLLFFAIDGWTLLSEKLVTGYL